MAVLQRQVTVRMCELVWNVNGPPIRCMITEQVVRIDVRLTDTVANVRRVIAEREGINLDDVVIMVTHYGMVIRHNLTPRIIFHSNTPIGAVVDLVVTFAVRTPESTISTVFESLESQESMVGQDQPEYEVRTIDEAVPYRTVEDAVSTIGNESVDE